MTHLATSYSGEYQLSIIGPDNVTKTTVTKKNHLFPAFYKNYVFSDGVGSYGYGYPINAATLIVESPEATALFESPDWYRKIYYDESGITTKLLENKELSMDAFSRVLENPGRLECDIAGSVDKETRIVGVIMTANYGLTDIKTKVFSCVKFDSAIVANASDLIKISYIVSATEFDEPTAVATIFGDLSAITLNISKLNAKLKKKFDTNRSFRKYNTKFVTNIGEKVFGNDNAYQVYFQTTYPVINTNPLTHTQINACSEFNMTYSGDIFVTGFTSNFTLNFGPEDIGKVLSVVDLKLTIPFAPWTDEDFRHIITGTGVNNVKFDR